MAEGGAQRTIAVPALLVALNIFGFAPVGFYIWLVVAHGDDSGSEILAVALAPFFLVTLIALVADFVVAVRSLRRPSTRARRAAAIAVVVIIGGFFVYSSVAVAVGAWKRHERNQPLSLSDARSLVARCEVRMIVRRQDETHIVLRESTDGSFQRHTDRENFESLTQAASNAEARCGHLDLVDGAVALN
jgi:hypothetical protein